MPDHTRSTAIQDGPELATSATVQQAIRPEPPAGQLEDDTDPLTGLPTAFSLNQKLTRLLQQSRQQSVIATLALLQLANFYEIRAWVGRAEADFLLSDIARVISQAIPGAALLYRCAHYEFALLLTGECSANAELITDRIKSSLQAAVSDTIPPQLTLRSAVGLARLLPNIPSPQVLFARARHDLSQPARGATRDQLPPADAIQLIQRGLRKDGLRLNYQPCFSLRPDKLRRFEVRARLFTGKSQLTGDRLFELAGQNALGETLDHLIIAAVLSLLRNHSDDGLQLTVNLSINSLVSDEFIPWLASQLAREPELSQRLKLQLSELDILVAQHFIGSFSEELARLGIGLGISHFGCMDEPLAYMALIRAEFVKLDDSVLARCQHDQEGAQALELLVTRLQGKGLRVMAAMLEDRSVLPLLWQAGINTVQGYGLAAPGDDLNLQFPAPKVID